MGPAGLRTANDFNRLGNCGTVCKPNTLRGGTTNRVPLSGDLSSSAEPATGSSPHSLSGAAHHLRQAICDADSVALDDQARRVWRAFSDGDISEGDASSLHDLITRRRPVQVARPVASAPSVKSVNRYRTRQKPCRPDREASRARRRTLGGSGCMPAHLGSKFSEGLRAVLCVVAMEVKRRGVCDFPLDQIAALAGVCRTTVQTALHEARLCGLIRITHRPRRGAKSRTNLVEIISPEWRTWLCRGRMARPSWWVQTTKNVSPTNSIGSEKGPSARVRASRYDALQGQPLNPHGSSGLNLAKLG